MSHIIWKQKIRSLPQTIRNKRTHDMTIRVTVSSDEHGKMIHVMCAANQCRSALSAARIFE